MTSGVNSPFLPCLSWISCLCCIGQAVWPASLQNLQRFYLSTGLFALQGSYTIHTTIHSFTGVLRIQTLASTLHVKCFIHCYYFVHWAISQAFKHLSVRWKSDLSIALIAHLKIFHSLLKLVTTPGCLLCYVLPFEIMTLMYLTLFICYFPFCWQHLFRLG